MGVRGIQLDEDDYVIDMGLVFREGQILTISENGYGKRTPIDEYRSQKRGGRGIITMKITEKTGNLVALKVVNEDDELMMINSEGIIIRIGVDEISTMSRNTQGVMLMRIEEGNKVVSVAKIKKDEDEDLEPEK